MSRTDTYIVQADTPEKRKNLERYLNREARRHRSEERREKDQKRRSIRGNA